MSGRDLGGSDIATLIQTISALIVPIVGRWAWPAIRVEAAVMGTWRGGRWALNWKQNTPNDHSMPTPIESDKRQLGLRPNKKTRVPATPPHISKGSVAYLCNDILLVVIVQLVSCVETGWTLRVRR